jgi:hypothetical protein
MIVSFLLAKTADHFIAGLCNGSTTDSGSVCLGSNPSPAANKKPLGLYAFSGILFSGRVLRQLAAEKGGCSYGIFLFGSSIQPPMR